MAANREIPAEQDPLLLWAISRWRAEVERRPLHNIHRRTLDDAWRQVIRRLGGDEGLIGPPHDELLQAGGAAPELQATPAARWRTDGKPDPHGNRYACERAALPFGDMTDDELANAVFLCDHRRDFNSMALLTAAKDRIRWLSRALAAATEPKP